MSDEIVIEPDSEDNSGKKALPEKVSLEQYKAWLYLMKQTRDTDIKLYDNNKIFILNDITDLDARIAEKLRLTDNLTLTVKIVVSLSNKEVKSFGTWEAFKTHNWQSINSQVESMVLDWDFSVLIPQQKTLPQTHTLKIRIGSELRPSEFFHVVMNGGEDFEISEVTSQMICKVDFINSVLASEYLNLVSDWYEGLSKNEPTSSLVTFFKNNRRRIRSGITVLALVTGVIILNIGFKAAINYLGSQSISQVSKWFFAFLTSSVPFLYIAYLIGDYYTDSINDIVFKFKESPIFRITRGDISKVAEYKAANNKFIIDIRNKLIVSLIASGIILFFGTFIPDLIKKVVSFWLH
ncbi:hypothetical protein [Spirosoma endbachense]|nr:hypothetical protein [Spirosoma endbachense]